MSFVAGDITCGGCDYNLRGLPDDGACPECGHGVGATLRGQTRRRAAWLRRVSWGAMLIGGGIAIGSAGVAATVQRREPWVLYLFPLGAVVAAAGTWMFASPRQRRVGWGDVALRLAGLATCALQLLTTFFIAQAMRYLTLWMPRSRNPMPFAEAAAVVWAVAACLTCIRAARLAGHVNDRPGVVQARMLAVLSAATLVAGVLIWGDIPSMDAFVLKTHMVASGIVSAWSAVFFLGFSIVPRLRARQAAMLPPVSPGSPT